jgi:hypothetical protein
MERTTSVPLLVPAITASLNRETNKMRTKKMRLVLVAIVSLLVAVPTILPSTSANILQEQDFSATLIQIAKSAVEAQNRILVGGDISVSAEDPLASAYANVIQQHTPDILRHRADLGQHQLAYTGFQTELTATRTRIKAAKATLWATEHTTLDLQSPGGPPTSGYDMDHRFDFVYENEAWKLVSDRVIDEFKSEVPDPNALPLNLPPTIPESPQSSIQGNQLEPQSVSLNRSATISYATTYWSNYNRGFRSFGNDCTNFASQCVSSGGWTMVSGWYLSQSVWWYNFLNQSRTWVNSNDFAWFTYTRPRGYILQYVNQLQPGDILQADWDGPRGHLPDGIIDHTMIVTARASNGEIFLTYHSNNRLNRPFFSDLLRAEPKAQWYAWRLYTYFG